jgi:hypothetical protein
MLTHRRQRLSRSRDSDYDDSDEDYSSGGGSESSSDSSAFSLNTSHTIAPSSRAARRSALRAVRHAGSDLSLATSSGGSLAAAGTALALASAASLSTSSAGQRRSLGVLKMLAISGVVVGAVYIVLKMWKKIKQLQIEVDGCKAEMDVNVTTDDVEAIAARKIEELLEQPVDQVVPHVALSTTTPAEDAIAMERAVADAVALAVADAMQRVEAERRSELALTARRTQPQHTVSVVEIVPSPPAPPPAALSPVSGDASMSREDLQRSIMEQLSVEVPVEGGPSQGDGKPVVDVPVWMPVVDVPVDETPVVDERPVWMPVVDVPVDETPVVDERPVDETPVEVDVPDQTPIEVDVPDQTPVEVDVPDQTLVVQAAAPQTEADTGSDNEDNNDGGSAGAVVMIGGGGEMPPPAPRAPRKRKPAAAAGKSVKI